MFWWKKEEPKKEYHFIGYRGVDDDIAYFHKLDIIGVHRDAKGRIRLKLITGDDFLLSPDYKDIEEVKKNIELYL